MRYLSLFSGIEAASVAWHGSPLNWTPVGFAEIEPFPCAVLKHHYPQVPNLGDVTAADFVDRAKALGPIDLIIAGAPCVAFSVAGLRKSLDDSRGNLTLRTLEIVNALDPAFFVFENVPGLLSTHDNAFGCFLAGLSGASAPLVPAGKRGRWTDAGVVVGPQRKIAWRVLDAQYFGLAQRRRRVFVVGCPRNGADPWEILLESDCLQGHTPPRRPTRQETAADVGSGPAVGSRSVGADAGEAGCLTPEDPQAFRGHGTQGAGPTLRKHADSVRVMVPTPYQNHEHGNYRQSDTAETLAVSPGRQREANLVGLPDPAYAITGGPGGQQFGSGRDGQDTFVVSCPSEPVVYDPNQVTSAANRSNPQAGDPCHTLPGSAELPILALGFNHQEQQNFRAEAELTNPKRVGQTEAVCVQLSGDRHDPGVSISEEQTFTLSANPMSDRGQAVAFQQNTREEVRLIGGDGTLCGDRSAQAGAHQQNYVAGFLPSQGAKAEGIGYEEQMAPSPKAGCHDYGLLNRAQVRRLLPEEREALQGFPRGYTQIPYKGKPAADGPRYKSLGNSMAVPVVLWIGQRIQTVAGQPTPTDGEEV